MLTGLVNNLVSMLSASRHKRFIRAAVFLVILAPVVVFSLLGLTRVNNDLVTLLTVNSETTAHLAASLLKERFDRLADIATSLATRVQFRRLITEGKWEEAIAILESVPRDFPFIERTFLADPKGVLVVDSPALPNVRGKDFSFRDWYRGVIESGRPYISEVYRRSAEPQYTVIAIAAPIKAESGALLGILVLQIRLETIFEWSKDIKVGQDGFIYFVDHTGKLASHPSLYANDSIIDFSSAPTVQRVLKGESGSGVFFNPIENVERFSAYEPVPEYGWGALVVEPIQSAFAPRDANILFMSFLIGTALLVNGVLIYIIVRVIETLNDIRKKQKIFLESIGDGIVAIDRDWNITLFNNAAERLTGWTWQEVRGRQLREVVRFLRERDRVENVVFIENAMVLGTAHYMEEDTLLIRKDGSEIPVGDSAAPMFDDHGKTSGAIIVFRDRSKEKEALHLRSDFSYASHQLRTPVAQALWNIELCLKDQYTEETKAHIFDAYLGVKNLSKLVNQLLEVSEIDQGTVIPKREEVTIAEIVGEIIAAARNDAQARNIAIETPQIPIAASMRTDRKLFRRILEEIFDNAIEYSLEKSSVQCAFETQAQDIVISVFNKGSIPEGEKALIFTKFFRGSNVPEKSIGAGLGLYIAREYVKLLGGKIWFQSEEGKGTIFFILLPTT